MTRNPGELLSSRYRLDEPIASGGMGEVWRGTDELLGRPVAVKVLHPGGTSLSGGEHFRARFRDEARHSAGLSHPHIATVYDFGDDDGDPYLVMELVEGQSLAALLAIRGPLPAEEVAALLGQAALALQAAHAAGVVHRDVKPANIMVTPAGMAKLTDFGIARAATGSGLTRTGEVLGTPHYLSPEQAMGHTATPASDVYALGVIGHELLTGRRPFDGESMVATALAHVNAPAPELPAGVPEPLRSTVMAALAKEPADRPSSAGDVAALLGMPGSPVPPSAAPTAALTSRPAAGAFGGPTEPRHPLGATEPDSLETGSLDGRTTVLPAVAAYPTTLPATSAGTDTGSAGGKPRPAWLWPAAATAVVLLLAFVAISLGHREDGTTPAAVPSSGRTSLSGPTTSAATAKATSTPDRTTASRAPAPVTTAAPKAPAQQGKGNGKGKGGKKK